jgi:hypothetical protein
MDRQGILAVDGKEVEIVDHEALARLAGTRWLGD